MPYIEILKGDQYVPFNIFFSVVVYFLPYIFVIGALFRILRDAGDD